MPYILTDNRKRCSPGSKRISKPGAHPIKCLGNIKKRKSSTRRGCTHGRSPKTKKCYSKKEFQSLMRSADKRIKKHFEELFAIDNRRSRM